MANKYSVETKLPVCYYVWVLLNIVLTSIFIFYNTILNAIVFELIFGIFSYIIIARYACKVKMGENRIIVQYPFPFFQTIIVDFEKNDLIKYKLGYYYYFNDEHRISRLQLINPQDEISFYKSRERSSHYRTIRVNTNYKGFNLFKKELAATTEIIKSYDPF
ncbi:hypothetical protein [Ferruginibacter sp.]|nr:hypothetical protein [Ferruginibacter sp.]